MTDAARLSALLEDYASALDGHLVSVREEFAHLERAWAGLSDVYAGTAADQFRNVFLASAGRMRDYERDATTLVAVLRRRIEALRDFDTPDPNI
ncbi:MAG: hypothetical protein GC151_13480 [Betaproteobacteria bacterium]|nr:hypothetical protein [Betaproteobacteria bacterium]